MASSFRNVGCVFDCTFSSVATRVRIAVPFCLTREMYTRRVKSSTLKQINCTGINVLVYTRELQNGSTAWIAVTRY
jgi:hypothetical protein